MKKKQEREEDMAWMRFLQEREAAYDEAERKALEAAKSVFTDCHCCTHTCTQSEVKSPAAMRNIAIATQRWDACTPHRHLSLCSIPSWGSLRTSNLQEDCPSLTDRCHRTQGSTMTPTLLSVTSLRTVEH